VTGQFHCFGCGESGDIFTFYARLHNLNTKDDFKLVVKGIFSDFGIPENGDRRPKKRTLNHTKRPFEHYELGKPIESYAYHTESNQVLFYNNRFQNNENKSFRQCDATGLIWSVKGLPVIPYRLPEIAKKDITIVFITEGEKDVHTLEAFGYVATTNAGGAASWKQEHAIYLYGKERIVIFEDNDKAGRDRTKNICESLSGKVGNISVVRFPAKPENFDITDFAESFDDKQEAAEKIAELIDTAEPYYQPIDRFFELIDADELIAKPAKIDFMIDQYVEDMTVTTLIGEYGHYKTFIAISMAGCVATGIEWMGHKVKQGPVVYILGEGHGGFGRRLKAFAMYHGMETFDGNFLVSNRPAQLTAKESVDEVKRQIDKLTNRKGPPKLVVIDTLNRNFGPGNENATQDMTIFVSNIDSYIRGYANILILHHPGHGDKTRGRGSYSLPAALDQIFQVVKQRPFVCKLSCKKMKDAPEPPDLNFDLEIVEIGEQDGKTIGSLVPVFQSEARTAQINLTGKSKKTYDELVNQYHRQRTNLESSGGDAANARVLVKDWQEACINAGTFKTSNEFHVYKRRLKEDEVITLDEHFAYPETEEF
jgi:5S rRNA maturation endonuclease (ribonuclease M5)